MRRVGGLVNKLAEILQYSQPKTFQCKLKFSDEDYLVIIHCLFDYTMVIVEIQKYHFTGILKVFI